MRSRWMTVARAARPAAALLLVLVSGGFTALDAADADPTVISRGASTAVHFDVSPPLSELAQQGPTTQSIPAPFVDRDRPSGLEGPLGPKDLDQLVQHEIGSGEIPTASVGFDAFSNVVGGGTPPDPVGAVGPNHYVVMANVRYAVYSKTGTLLAGPANINTLWSGFGGACETENAGDPIVLYDRHADRWLLSQFTAAGPTYFNCVALSQTPDPTGAYFRWAFSTGGNFPDYPKYGTWRDAYYIATREFTGVGGPFAGIGAYAVDRAAMLAGSSTPVVIGFLATPGATPYTVGDGLLPSDMDGDALPPAGRPNFFIGSRDNGGPYGAPSDALNIWSFHADFGTPANSTFSLVTVPVAAFDSIFPCSPGSRDCIPQPGTTQKVDHQGYRQRVLHRAAYRNLGTHESIVTNQSVDVGGMSGIRWYEIRSPNSSPTIFQQGTYAPADGVHRWFGSIAQDRDGNMALGFSASNATTVFPSIRYTGRLVDDPLGTMPQGEGTFVNGAGSQTGSPRWGDYTAMTVDPTDDCTFWYVNEYYPASSATGWRLRVGAFQFPQCEAPVRTAFTFDDTTASQAVDRMIRDGDASSCFAPGAPGLLGSAGTYSYQTRTFFNNGPARCITATLRTTCLPPSQISVNAYSPTVTPATRTGPNWLGDGGSSALPSVTFSFNAPADSPVVFLIERSNPVGPGLTDCDYTIESNGLTPPLGRDFNLDGHADILWRNTTSGTVSVWLLNGGSFLGSGSPGGAGSDWVIVGVGDFNGDGKADLLWRHTPSGALYVWLMNGTVVSATGTLGAVGGEWTVAGVADFNGDGKADILWRNTTTGGVFIWFMNGTAVSSTTGLGSIPSVWAIVGVGDFNGDGKADILWRNTSTGAAFIWLLNGGGFVGTGSPGGAPPGDWVIVAVADFDADGKSDILWRNTVSGAVYIWFVNGTSVVDSVAVGTAGTDWTIARVSDFNGDGQGDLLWRNTSTGLTVIWFLNGGSFAGSASLGVVGLDWAVQ